MCPCRRGKFFYLQRADQPISLVAQREHTLAKSMRIFCLLLLLLAVTSCGDKNIRDERPGGALIRLSDADARGLDPQMVSDLSSIRIAADQFEGLTRFNAKGEAETGLAENWRVSDDGKTWTFKLRAGLKFSDGTDLTAPVFAKALQRIRAKDSGSPHVSLFDVIDSISALDDNNVQINLKNPFPQLPALLAHPAMAALPFHLIDKKGEDWTISRPMVTSGPYRLTVWKLNQHIKLEANPNWAGGKPVTAVIIWRPMDNKQSGMRSVLSGAADTSSDFPDNRLAWLKSKYPKLVRSNAYLATYYFAFNTRRPPFDDVRVRRALSMAIDRRWMTDEMIAAGNKPAFGLLPPGLRGNDPSLPKSTPQTKPQRLAEAKRLLREAGYSASKPLAFEIRFNSSSEHRRAAVAMASMWRELGVDASLLNSEASLHFDSLKRGDFALARSGWVADLPAPENFLAVHRSDAGPQNYSGYSNPAYDRALNEAMAEADPALRAAKMRHVEAILIGDMPILPLYFYVTKALVQPDVSGWQDNISNIHPSYSLSKQAP
jgi:oligopeptide transport system substrate-binding protein